MDPDYDPVFDSSERRRLQYPNDHGTTGYPPASTIEEVPYDANYEQSYAPSNSRAFPGYGKPSGDPGLGKKVLGTIILGGILWLLVAGFTQDIRYLWIIGLSLAGFLVLSLIVNMFRSSRLSLWDILILDDLIRLLFFIGRILIYLIVEILLDRK